MALFDLFRKKNTGKETRNPQEVASLPTDEYLDDMTFIRDIKHIQAGSWHQYDVLLAARGYGWDMMIDWADYMSVSDLEHISQVTTGYMGTQEKDITESYNKSNRKCAETQEMLDSLWAVFAQIRADQKKEEYDDILVMVSEITYFLQNELGCGFPAYGIPQSGEFDF